ncbi:MAG: metal-dependent hydrolase [Granulosicoccaceae bacterium]
MADFNTHVLTAAGVASIAATVTAKLLNLPADLAILFTVCGSIGGVAPDIDLKYSWPSKILFSVLGAVVALIMVFTHLATYTVTELIFGAIGFFLLIRFPIWWLFHQFTVHRGALHSIAACFMFAIATAAASSYFLSLTSENSWLLACFMFGGCIIHLLLDELYSVDFMGARIKRSFGSALKLVDSERILASCAVLFASLVLWIWTPPLEPLIELFKQTDVNWNDLFVPDWVVLGKG